MLKSDTIAAVSTAPGTSGIGIVRMSGIDALSIAAKIFKGKSKFEEIRSHTVNFGSIVNPENDNILDEVLLTVMKAPNTYTREDIIEINCHGGIITIKGILELLIKQGARIAEPGEFTKRAFLNGRIDLSQAEAVIDLINSKTGESSRAALNQLEGKLSRKIGKVRDKLIQLIAHIEVTVDYPEHDIEDITGKQVYDEALLIRDELTKIIADFEKGRIIREGINIVIVGKPNVGKSSLLNELSGNSKAIVTDVPGTTRDLVEEYINIRGIPVKIVDTAGIRQTEDVVEKIGVERAESALYQADLVLMMLDAQEGLDEDSSKILDKVGDKKLIILINKTDLVDKFETPKRLKDEKVIEVSVKAGSGIDILENEIAAMFIKGDISSNSEILITNVRHKDLIEKAINEIENACEAYVNGMPIDCITIDIKNAAELLGMITGQSISEDVMHEIFNRFCIGK